MKPAITPYDRHSRLGLKMMTVNPCNQFIVQTLLRWKVNVQKQGLNQFYTYNLAVESVRKYPLPILCYEQMKVMEGFGKFFCTAVAKLVRTHYRRGRLPTKEQKQAIDKDHELFLRREMKKLKNTNNKNGQKTEEDDEQNEDIDDGDIESEKFSQFNDNFQSQFQQGSDQDSVAYSDYSDISDSASVKSNKSYRPKPGTQNFFILKAMYTYLQKNEQQQKVSKGDINLQLYEWKMDKVRTWHKATESLKQSGYIKVDPQDDYYLLLTTKAKDYIQDALSNADNDVKYNHMWVLRKQPVQNVDSMAKLSLLINSKASFKQEQELVTRLSAVGAQYMQVKQAEFELSTFLWMLEAKVLDYMAFRVKIDNLDIQWFLKNCLGAKDSGCSNIYFIFEFPEDDTKSLIHPLSQIDSLMANARASEFRVIKTKGLSQTIQCVLKIGTMIKESLAKVPNGYSVMMVGTLEFYNQKNKRYLPIHLRQVTKKMLKCIPKMKRKAVQVIIQKLPSFKALYNQLFQLPLYQQKIDLLNWWLKQCGSKPAVNMILFDLLFSESYELPDEQII